MTDTHTVDMTTHEHPSHPDRSRVPHMEGWAYNQKPKIGYVDLELYRYDGTNLYQWFGRKEGSVFVDGCDIPFTIKPRVSDQYTEGYYWVERVQDPKKIGGRDRWIVYHQLGRWWVIGDERELTLEEINQHFSVIGPVV